MNMYDLFMSNKFSLIFMGFLSAYFYIFAFELVTFNFVCVICVYPVTFSIVSLCSPDAGTYQSTQGSCSSYAEVNITAHRGS